MSPAAKGVVISDGTIVRCTRNVFPRSSVKKQTLEAHWRTEEIHSVVKTHDADDNPIDLSGAILAITVMDNIAFNRIWKWMIALIGTFSFNLANLVQQCNQSKPTPKAAAAGVTICTKGERTVGDGATTTTSERPKLQSTRRGDNRAELVDFFHFNWINDKDNEEEEEDLTTPIATVQIDEPLLRNAGRIQCVTKLHHLQY